METIEKNEIFDKIVDFIGINNNNQLDTSNEIVIKHGWDNIKSITSESFSNINDPFERAVLALYLIDDCDLTSDNVTQLINDHGIIFKIIKDINYAKNTPDNKLHVGYTSVDREKTWENAKKNFDEYMKNFK